MKPVREVVGRDMIEDLWGEGYTIIARPKGDPFNVPATMIPVGMSYQWWHLVHDKVHFVGKWAAVPASRHDGYFMPAGHVGNIEVQGMGLFEKAKSAVDAHQAEAHAKAHQNVIDWIDKAAADGLSGQISVGGMTTDVGNDQIVKNETTKTIETRVRLPREMMPYMSEIFAERDRLYEKIVEDYNYSRMDDAQTKIYMEYVEAATANPDILKGPALNALLLPTAIENVRKSLVTTYQPPKE